MKISTIIQIALLCAVGVLFAACRPQSTAPVAKPAGFDKEFGSGALTMKLHLDRVRLTMAEQLQVDLRAETGESHSVKETTDLKEVPGLQLVEETKSEPELLTGGRVAVTFHYTLAPLTPGELTLPSLTVEAWSKREKEAAITTVKTEPVTIRVDSLLGKSDAGKLADIAPPVAKPISPWVWVGAGAGLLVILALLGYLWKRHKDRAAIPPPPIPPHLLAYQALDRLLAANLLTAGEMDAFYATLSGILRSYLEQAFGLRAPERTTEEFLAELRCVASGPIAAPEHKRLLREFLCRCDLIKFAREIPNRPEAEEAVALCRRFIRATEPDLAVPQPEATP